MPTDIRRSPWNATRERQSLTEELYVSTTVTKYPAYEGETRYRKLTSTTSLGYFELPSARNGNMPGDLQVNDPFGDDETQLYENNLNYKRGVNTSYAGNETLLIERNRGPLASVAIDLFGRWSFLETRMSNPSMFAYLPTSMTYSYGPNLPGQSTSCDYKAPLYFWMTRNCVIGEPNRGQSQAMHEVMVFLQYFDREYRVPEALNHALFIANKLWLGGGEDTRSSKFGNIKISQDRGIPTIKPKISRTGIIVCSVFLGIHLLGLMILAIYVGLLKPWCETMGAEVMMKMGMVYSDVLSRSETEYQWERILNELPGFIGDDRPNDEVGRLRLGAMDGLSTAPNRKFEVLR